MIVVQGRFRNALLRSLDAASALLLPQARARVRPVKPRVLIIRCDGLGDAVLSTAVLQAIRDALQPSRMDIVCSPTTQTIFEKHPAIDTVLPFTAPWWMVRERSRFWHRMRAWLGLPQFILHLRKQRYDIGIDLRGDFRHFVFFLASPGIPERISSDRTGGHVFLTTCVPFSAGQHEVERMASITVALGGLPSREPVVAHSRLSSAARARLGLSGHYIAIVPKGTGANREWPAEHIAHLAERVEEEFGIPLVHVGTTADRALSARVQLLAKRGYLSLVERTSLDELVAVLAGADVVVAMDSGPMHIAAATGVPLIALWGPTPADFLPLGSRVSIVRASSRCECPNQRTCSFADGPGRCFVELRPEDVVRAIRAHIPSAVLPLTYSMSKASPKDEAQRNSNSTALSASWRVR